MYNFIISDNKKKIKNFNLKETEQFLIGIKRLLPRWLNSLPDSEFITILRKLYSKNKKKICIVETGIGSSTLLFLHFAMLNNGTLLSWDTNSTKASYINMIASETLCKLHKKPVSEHWKFINSTSLDNNTGLSMISDLTKSKIDISFHDSDHTWKTISGEILSIIKKFSNNSFIFVDDANQNYNFAYEPIINMIRKKNNLKPIKNIKGNIGPTHYERLPGLIKQHVKKFSLESNFFNKRIKSDIFYEWYNNDRNKMNDLGMEKLNKIQKRFFLVNLIKLK